MSLSANKRSLASRRYVRTAMKVDVFSEGTPLF